MVQVGGDTGCGKSHESDRQVIQIGGLKTRLRTPGDPAQGGYKDQGQMYNVELERAAPH